MVNAITGHAVYNVGFRAMLVKDTFRSTGFWICVYKINPNIFELCHSRDIN
jgi:hypothetical protein